VTTLEQLAESRKQSVDQLSREKDEVKNKIISFLLIFQGVFTR